MTEVSRKKVYAIVTFGLAGLLILGPIAYFHGISRLY
jgi:hypothetical protein